MKPLQLLTARSGAVRAVLRTTPKSNTVRPLSAIHPSQRLLPQRPIQRSFSNSTPVRIALTDPVAPKPEASNTSTNEPASLSDSEYHEIADQYLNTLQLAVEEVADNDATKGLEVEYSAGVLTINHPSKGTYVINKQPPNKQIWLSSPESGPKRYDWVLGSTTSSDSMNSKQDTEGSTGALGDDGRLGGGKWMYLRTGESMTDLIRSELEVEVASSEESDVNVGREGPGGSGGASSGPVEG